MTKKTTINSKSEEKVDEKREAFKRYLRKNIEAEGKVSENSIRTYTGAINQFEQFLDGRKPTKKLVDVYYDLMERTHKVNSLISIFGALRHYLRYLGWKDEVVKALVPIPKSIIVKTENSVLNADEIQALFNATKNDILTNTILKCLYHSAIRREELRDLDIDDINFETKVVTIRNGKGKDGQPEEILPPEEFFDAVKRYLEVRPKVVKAGSEKALFIQPKNLHRITFDSIRRFLLKAQVNSGMRSDIRLTPHVFRASNITDQANNGGDYLQVSILSRHKSIDAYKRYVRQTREQKRATTERLLTKITETTIKAPEPKQEPPVGMFAKPVEQTPTEQTTLYDLLKQGLINPQQYQELLSSRQQAPVKQHPKHPFDPNYG